MRATPLTILSPVPWWWAIWVRFTWLVARLTSRVTAPPRDRAAPRSMLFLTSFDGSGIQYIEAFVRVVPARINGLYWGAKGFPGPRRFGPVNDYIEAHSHH